MGLLDPLLLPFIVDFLESFKKNRMLFVLFFTISIILGFNDPSLNQETNIASFRILVYSYLAVFGISSIYIFKRSKNPPESRQLIDYSIVILWGFSMICAVSLELVLVTEAIRAFLTSELSLFGTLSFISFLIPIIVSMINRNK